MEIITWFLRGGIVMWPILLCSVVALYIIVERWLAFRSAKPPGGAFQLKLRKVLESRDVRMAQELCIQEKSPVGRIVGAGLEKVHHGPMRVRQAMEDQGKEEFSDLERHMGVLASISTCLPLRVSVCTPPAGTSPSQIRLRSLRSRTRTLAATWWLMRLRSFMPWVMVPT